jgi:hypothetical protein
MHKCDDARRSVFMVVLLLLVAALPAAAQLQTGNLFGTVADDQGGALPGVTVTVTGAAVAPLVQVSDEGGRFRFLNLYPGSYALKAELDGFSTVEVGDIGIRVGANANVEVTMNAAIRDVINVTAESPLLDERKQNTGSNVSASDLSKVPTARDPWSLLSQAPGVIVDRVNVGGNESGQQSSFLGSGSGGRDNVFAVDGVVLTDMNAVGGSAVYYDFGAYEEVQFTTSSTDVTVATAGVTINQVTKRGTNDWRAQVRYLRTDGDWQSDPELADGSRIDSVEEQGADIGGPVLKDHLWIWGSYGESDIRNLAQGTLQLDRTKLRDFNSKMNYQFGSKDSGVLHYWRNNKLKFGRGASPTRAPETTLDQTTPSKIWKFENTILPSSTFSSTILVSRNDGAFTLDPQGGLDADIFRDENDVLHGTNFQFAQTARIDQAKVDNDYFLNVGSTSHQLKFGGSFREQENHSGTVWPRGKLVTSGQLLDLESLGFPAETAQVIFPRNRKVNYKTAYGALWVQDSISADRLTVNAGVRLDKQYGSNLPAADPGNPLAQGFLPAIDFQGNHAGGFSWKTISPRVGATYALGEDRSTLLRGSFSRYAEQLGQNPLIGRVNPLGYSYAYFYFTDANRNLVLDPGEVASLEFSYAGGIDPDNPASLSSPNVNDRNLTPAITDEVTFGVDHGFTQNFAANLNFTFRNIHDIPERRLLVRDEAGNLRQATRADYAPDISEDRPDGLVHTTLPDGTPVGIPVFHLRDGLEPTGGGFYTNGDREQDYKGVSLTLTRRLANRWSARGAFTYNDWKWKMGKKFRSFDDPNDAILDGLGNSDGNDTFFEPGGKGDVFAGSKWSFSTYALYQIAPDRPWGFNCAGSVNGRQGFITPPSVRYNSGAGGINLQLTKDISRFRNPNVITVDARLEKDFHLGSFDLNVGIDGFNLTNESYVLQRERNSLAEDTYFSVVETLSPRVFRAGVTVKWR